MLVKLKPCKQDEHNEVGIDSRVKYHDFQAKNSQKYARNNKNRKIHINTDHF